MQVTVKDLKSNVIDVFVEVIDVKVSLVPTHIVIEFEDRQIMYPVKDFILIREDDGTGVE